MKQKLLGIFFFAVSTIFFFAIVQNKFEGIIFLMGMGYGLILFLQKRLESVIFKIKHPIFLYGFLVFIGGMLIEILAYVSNIPKIRSGGKVYLFSENLFVDLIIGLPHYFALGIVWARVLKKYRLSAFQQAILIGLFWGIVVDEFSHFFALLSGNFFSFFIAGLFMVFALNTPLVIMQRKLQETYPNRNNRWAKYPVAFSHNLYLWLCSSSAVFYLSNRHWYFCSKFRITS